MKKAPFVDDTNSSRDLYAQGKQSYVYRLTQSEIKELSHGYAVLAIPVGDSILYLGIDPHSDLKGDYVL